MIPQLLLEEILLGEKEEKKYYDKYGKENIQTALAELRKSNEKILAAYPAESLKKKPLKFNKAFLLSTKILTFSTAAVLVMALAGTLLANHIDVKNETVSAERTKGTPSNHQLKLYRQKGTEAVQLKDGESAEENDLIQITYLPGSFKYGLIFSVDGNGSVTHHLPESTWISEKLKKTGEEVPLAFSYALDDAPDYECFVFVVSKKSFDMSKIENVDKNKYSIEYLKNGSYLPSECESSVFVLNKK